MNFVSYRQGMAAMVILGICAATMLAQAPVSPGPTPLASPTQSTVTLRYLEVRQPLELKFIFQNQSTSKPVGKMAFDYPATSFPVQGIAPGITTYCVEALVPIHAGNVYSFAIDPIDRPEFFGLPDTEAGRVEAVKRAGYIRELYGRFYQDTLTQPELAVPAFQTALWEVIQERELAAAPASPFNLYTGVFRANYPNEAESPAFVQQAQRYVLALNGEESRFATNPATAGQELVRFTGLATANTPAPQSQLALRGALDANSPLGDAGPGGLAPALGQSSMMPTGIPLLGRGGLGAPGLRSPGAPGLGGAGGAGGGFPFLGGAGVPNTSTETNPLTSPQTANLPLTLLNSNLPSNFGASSSDPVTAPQQQPGNNSNPNLPLAPTPPGSGVNDPNSNNPSGQNPGGPNPNGPNPNGNTPQDNNPNNPIPAPPAVVLGLIGMGVISARRWWKSRLVASAN